MELTQGPFTSADWLVTKGNERAFMEQWESLARISLESPGARWFLLIRDVADPRHFVSFGQWDDFGSITTARDGSIFPISRIPNVVGPTCTKRQPTSRCAAPSP